MPFPKARGKAAKAKESWCNWLRSYGIENFFDSMIYQVQGVQSTCKHCGETIYCDIVEGGGCPDWGTKVPNCVGLDFGCPDSPDTNNEGTGGHAPIKGKP